MTYYTHSGKYDVSGVFAGLTAGILAATIVAFAYDYAILTITMEKLRILVPMGYGALVGSASGLAMCWAKVRNKLVAGTVGLVTSAVALYVSWAIWLVRLVQPSIWIFNPIHILLQPKTLWHLVLKVNSVGTWGYDVGKLEHGTFLWFVWVGEAALILGFGSFIASAFVSWRPFCEQCEAWCRDHQKFYIAPLLPAKDLKTKLENEDLQTVMAMERGDKKKPHFRLDLRSCGVCHNLNTLSLVQVFPRDTKTVVNKLALSTEQAAAIRSLGLNRS